MDDWVLLLRFVRPPFVHFWIALVFSTKIIINCYWELPTVVIESKLTKLIN